MSARRLPDSDLAYGDMVPQRWDREKFERYRRGGGYDERDYSFEERDRLDGGRERRLVDLDVTERRGPGRFEERERFVEEDRYGPSARRGTDFLGVPSETADTGRPRRRKSFVGLEVDDRVQSQQLIRRQNSFDTFDRRPPPRRADPYDTPLDEPVPLPVPRRRSPPRERERYREREYEEVRYRDLEPQAFEEYEDVHIRREKSREPPRRKSAAQSVRSGTSGSSSSFEEVETVEKKKTTIEIGKRGKTRMPKRLAHKQPIIDLGLPFEEEVSKPLA